MRASFEKTLCIARNKWIAKTPEEEVRQSFLYLMISKLGYPKKLLSVESHLKGFLPGQKVPGRRADILCFMPVKDTLKALLLLECKRGPLKEADFFQASGYNFYLKASFFGIASKNELFICGQNKKNPPFFTLPTYPDLIAMVSSDRTAGI